MRTHILSIKSAKSLGADDRSASTIFTNVLSSDLPAPELSTDRMVDEASGIVGGGIETVKNASLVTLFHLLANPTLLRRLRSELDAAFPNPHAEMQLSELEALPWLGACIEEGLRLSYGVVGRLPRIHRARDLHYKTYAIPAGTAVSSDPYTVNHNEDLFPDSHAFRPERWLAPSKLSDFDSKPDVDSSDKRQKKHFSFGRGTRACLGIQLAYAELLFIVAGLMPEFEFELFETDGRDVECDRDEIVPAVRRESKGVRVMVKSRTRR